MPVQDERPQLTGQLCPACFELVVNADVCPSCGPLPSSEDSDIISLPVNISILRCDCGHLMSVGKQVCRACGEPAEDGLPTDPRRAPLNRAKLARLGDLLPRFEAAAAFTQLIPEPIAVATDDQLITYINRNRLLSERLIGDLKDTTQQVDLSNKRAIGSAGTRRAFEDMLRGAEQSRAIHDNLAAVRAPEQLQKLHLLLQSVFRGLIELHLACAQGVLALTIEDVQAAQRSMKGSLDQLAVLGDSMQVALSVADPELAGTNQIGRRLGYFVGSVGSYEYRGLPDLAAVLSAALRNDRSMARLGRIGAAYFGGRLNLDPESLPDEQGLVLYVLAAEVAASDDPLTLLRRANVVLQLLNSAYEIDPEAMVSAVQFDQVEAEHGTMYQLSLQEILGSLSADDMSRDTLRLQLVLVYEKLVEGVYGRYINMPLVAKSLLAGQPKTYDQVAVESLGAKHRELEDSRDTRYAAAFVGVSTVARNAGAHCRVDTSGDLIRLTERDREGRTSVEELSEDGFTDRLRDLALTCRALRLAVDLFRLEHFDRMPPTVPTAQLRIAAEAARILVGFGGLVRATVDYRDANRIVIDADLDEHGPSREPAYFLPTIIGLTSVFPSSQSVELRVKDEGRSLCRLRIPTADARSNSTLPESARLFASLRLRYIAEIEPRAEPESRRYRRQIIQDSARLLTVALVPITRLPSELPAKEGDYLAALDEIESSIKSLTNVLTTVVPPDGSATMRDELLSALSALNRAFRMHRTLLNAGQWKEIAKPTANLSRALKTVVHLGR